MYNVRDYENLLNPAYGLAINYSVRATETVPTLYSVTIDIGQRLGGGKDNFDDLVGAWDVTLSSCLKRGAGEAVERFALHKPTRRESRDDERNYLSVLKVACGLPRAKICDAFTVANCCRKNNVGLIVHEKVLIDSDWINVPTSGEARKRSWFGTPSGTASHLTISNALDASIREIFERDSVLRTWNKLGKTERVLSFESDCKSCLHLKSLINRFGIRLYRVKSRADLPYTYIAWAINDGYAALGSSLGYCPVCSALHAAIESLQISALLKSVKSIFQSGKSSDKCESKKAAPTSYADLSLKRMMFWASNLGVEAWKKWDFDIACEAHVKSSHKNGNVTGAALAAHGYTHVWVDLTERLPQAVKDAGFVVVKSIVPEVQALSLSEGQEWDLVRDGHPYSFWEPLL